MPVIWRLPQGGRTNQQDINYLMLYDAGDECTEVTGGWNNNGWTMPQSLGGSTTPYAATKNAGDMTLDLSSVSAYHSVLAGTANPVDLNPYVRLCAKWQNCANSVSLPQLAITTDKNLNNSGQLKMMGCTSSTQHISSMDISSINGGAYIYYGSWGSAGEANRNGSMYHLFAVRPDEWQAWLFKANLSISDYADLDAVVADNSALTTLMSCKAAVDYMLYHCTGTVMAAVIRSETALEAIADSPYNTQIFQNKHWNKFLRMVGAVPESEKTYLYRYGDQCTDITGDWGAYAITSHTNNPALLPTLTANPESMTMVLNAPSSDPWYYRGLVAACNRINLSGYRHMKAHIVSAEDKVSIELPSMIGIALTSTLANYYTTVAAETIVINTGPLTVHNMVASIDISGLTSVYYLIFSLLACKAAVTITVDKIWLE